MIWLIGNKGMLGTELAETLAAARMEFVGTDREVDILSPEALAAFAEGKRIEWIVNCAAYTAVDRAEDEPELARALNEAGPANIAVLAARIGAKMLHISTDYVFDGTGSRPYREDDQVAPAGVYGRTKAAGEAAVRAACPEHVIVRTAWLYGKHGPNFVYTMLRLMKEKGKVGVVADQRGSPTWARDLAAAIVAVLRAPEPAYGTFHFTDGGETSWHEFACEIERLGRERGILSRPCEVAALSSAEYPTKAARPAYSVLSKERIKVDYAIEPPEWKASLAAFIEEITPIVRRQARWNALSDYDMRTAQVDLDAGQYRPVFFWCAQAVEKCLKGQIEFYERPKPVHDLLKLASFLRLELGSERRAFLVDLSAWYQDSRYGMEFESEEPEDASREASATLLASKELILWLRSKSRLPFA